LARVVSAISICACIAASHAGKFQAANATDDSCIYWFLLIYFVLTGGDILSQKEKLIARLLTRPADFTFDELIVLLGYFGYTFSTPGKTGGSRVAFTTGSGDYIRLHKPHPRNVLKRYQVDEIILILKERDFI
jgi:hypothetical protein